MIVLALFLNLAPVLVFLFSLILLDSFKLVKLKDMLLTILAGCLLALAALLINKWLLETSALTPRMFSRYFAPVIEESLKAFFVVYLMRRNKIGFMVDAAIYGFAVGTGFALTENIYHLQNPGGAGLFLWIVRGFGTAVMHGGATAIFAIICKSLTDRKSPAAFYFFLPGLAIAIMVHSFFNHFLLPPALITPAQLIALPLLVSIVFKRSEKSLREWMNAGLDTDVRMIEEIDAGRFSKTNAGLYLLSLREKFSGEVVADMFCLLRLHLELACHAKGILLMRQAGFPAREDVETKEKFAEMDYLRNSVGRIGLLAISPILNFSSRDLWQFYVLKANFF